MYSVLLQGGTPYIESYDAVPGIEAELRRCGSGSQSEVDDEDSGDERADAADATHAADEKSTLDTLSSKFEGRFASARDYRLARSTLRYMAADTVNTYGSHKKWAYESVQHSNSSLKHHNVFALNAYTHGLFLRSAILESMRFSGDVAVTGLP